MSSLIDIAIFPVSVGWVVPSANKSCKETRDSPFVKAGDEMGATDDVVGVKEPKRAVLVAGDKLYPVQPLCFPPGSMRVVDLEPMDPKYVHAGWCSHGGV